MYFVFAEFGKQSKMFTLRGPRTWCRFVAVTFEVGTDDSIEESIISIALISLKSATSSGESTKEVGGVNGAKESNCATQVSPISNEFGCQLSAPKISRNKNTKLSHARTPHTDAGRNSRI